jgi:pectate lyase
MKTPLFLVALVLLLMASPRAVAIDGARQYLNKPDEWYRSDEGRRVASNILSYQSDRGGWPKNVDTTARPYSGADRAKDLAPTFDNGATTDELRFLGRAWTATHDARYQAAYLKGYDYIIAAQYPTGGWPQFWPPPATSYHRHITFNDDAMVRLMYFLRDAAPLLDPDRRSLSKRAFERGVDCILKCQVRVDGKLTAWCAQHDEKDYSPRPGRSFELVSLSGSESVGITRLLMSLDQPSPEVVRAVEGAVAWFQSARLTGIKVVQRRDANGPRGFDKVVVQDVNAPPLWARFYDIRTNKPIYSDRDGVAKSRLADIGYERRNGYAWLGEWPRGLLEKEYPAWRAKWSSRIPHQSPNQ